MAGRRQRQGRSTLGSLVTWLVVIAVIGAGYLFIPKWWDYQQMKEISRLVASEWHLSENRGVARARLLRELENYGMPYYIPDTACRFEKDTQTSRVLYCEWNADVTIPFIEYTRMQTYTITTEVNRMGKVTQN